MLLLPHLPLLSPVLVHELLQRLDAPPIVLVAWSTVPTLLTAVLIPVATVLSDVFLAIFLTCPTQISFYSSQHCNLSTAAGKVSMELLDSPLAPQFSFFKTFNFCIPGFLRLIKRNNTICPSLFPIFSSLKSFYSLS